MYRPGHYGAALLVYSPVGFALVAAGQAGAALLAGVVIVGVTPLPDYDQRVPGLDHRGATHTVGFALLVGLGTAAVAAVLAPADPRGAVGVVALGFLAGTLSILAHLAGDVITPAGITPLWPLSDRHYSLEWVRAANPLANYLLLAAGVCLAGAALWVGSRVAGAAT